MSSHRPWCCNQTRYCEYRENVLGYLTAKQEAVLAVTADKPAPYATTSAILDIIGRYRNRGLPSPVNADVLARASIPGSLIPRTLQALVTLDLINEAGNPPRRWRA